MSAPIFAVVTPFGKDGALDLGAFVEYLHWLHDKGVRRILVGGTTGEFPSLTMEERRTLLESARDAFQGEVIAHVSTSCVQDTRGLLAHARDIADAAVLLPPYYYAEICEEGVRNYFSQTAGDCTMPLYVYNFPRHTQFNISVECFKSLKQNLLSLRGIKDSGGSWDQTAAYKKAAPEMEVVVGSDSAALRVLIEGVGGSVTGGANPVPRLMVEVFERFVGLDIAGAKAAQARLDDWTAARKATGIAEIALVKAALAEILRGFPAEVRPPLLNADRAKLRGVFERLRTS